MQHLAGEKTAFVSQPMDGQTTKDRLQTDRQTTYIKIQDKNRCKPNNNNYRAVYYSFSACYDAGYVFPLYFFVFIIVIGH